MIQRCLTLVAAMAIGIYTASAQTAASAVDGKKQTLFSSVNHESTPYRIPAVAKLNNGTVLAIADQRPCGADVGNGEVDIYAKVGTIDANGKYTWNPATTDPSANGGMKIADGTSSNGYGDAAVVVDRESGKVLVICVAGNVVFSSGSSSKHNKMARIVGSADGLTWESPQDVTSQFFANELSSAYTMFMASGRMVQSEKVKVGNYYRIYGALLVREKSGWFSKSNNNYVVYSDDFGATWNVLGGTYALKGGDEAKVEELPNGDIVMSSRTSGGRYFNVFKFSNLNNASGSWGSATKYSFGGSNSTNGELMMYRGLTDANGTEYNVMLQSLPTGSSRSNVAVFYKAFSTTKTSWSVSDFTSGWTKGIEVDNGASGYSTMTILPNGEVGFLYEDDYSTSKADGDYANIVYVPLTASELTNGKYTVAKEEPAPVQVATPVISPAGGSYESSVTVTIACATEGATIHYTLDGTTPTEASAKYSAALTLTESATLKAIAVKEGNYTASQVASATYTITQPVVEPEPEPEPEPETPEIDEALQAAITAAQEVLACSGVGYPSATAATRTALAQTIANVQAGSADATALSNAVSAFKSEVSDIAMPEEGRTYTFASVAKNGNKLYLKYSSSGISFVSDASQATGYTCEVIDASNGEYAFVTDEGKYLIWKGPSGTEGWWIFKKTHGYNDNLGYVASYNSTYCDLVVEKMTTGSNVSASSNADLFGMVAVKGWRYSRSEYGYFTIKTDGTFDASSTPYFSDTYSSALQIVDTGAATRARVRQDDNATAIDTIEAEETEETTAEGIYDMQGRKVTKMLPGRMYIVNGKKVLCK